MSGGADNACRVWDVEAALVSAGPGAADGGMAAAEGQFGGRVAAVAASEATRLLRGLDGA